ncbi:MAG TPA: hypothetical protein VN577_00845 [Terriglobales bacterium]|nr:hypothetical protein [Terriglobales bacterium]
MKFAGFILVPLLLVAVGCGGGSNNNSGGVSVTISPTSTTITAGSSVQFSASVSNATDTSVTWQVGGVTGGSTSVGTISTTGLYTSPSGITSTVYVNVTAVSVQDTSKNASATVTINATNEAPKDAIIISPTGSVLASGSQQTFTATVRGTAYSPTWSVSCEGQVSAKCGQISSSGVYTAPLFPPRYGEVTITATSPDASAITGNARVRIQISNQSLYGRYAFSMSGTSSGAFQGSAGSLVFDGQGNVTSGVKDATGDGGTPVSITGGTYHVGTDGRGNIALQSAGGTQNLSMVMVNHEKVLISGYDAGGEISTGAMDLQDPSTFQITSLQGAFRMSVQGASSTHPQGTFAAEGVIAPDGAGAIAQASFDINDTGTAQSGVSVTGAFSAPSGEGRGTLTLGSGVGPQSYAYFIVDAKHVKLVGTDSSDRGVAELVKQDSATYSNSSWNGAFVGVVSGSNSQGRASTGGVFTFNGSGGVTALIDTNMNGNVTAGGTVTGTYNVTDTTTGRTTVQWTDAIGDHQLVLYPSSDGGALIQVDGVSASGSLLRQTTALSFPSVFAGQFATEAYGYGFIGSAGWESLVGLTIPNGGSSVSGYLEINDNGTLAPGTTLGGSYLWSATGVAQVSATTNSAVFGNAFLKVYAADDSRGLLMGADSNRVITGVMLRQY